MFMCLLAQICGGSLYKSSSWQENWSRVRLTAFKSITWLTRWFFIEYNCWCKVKVMLKCGPLDNSHHVLDLWQIHSHNASLIYASPQVYPIIINEASGIRCPLLSVLLTGRGEWRNTGKAMVLFVWQKGSLTLNCVTTATRVEEQRLFLLNQVVIARFSTHYVWYSLHSTCKWV